MLPTQPQQKTPLLLTLSPLSTNNRLILVTSDRSSSGLRRATTITPAQSAALLAQRCANTRVVSATTPANTSYNIGCSLTSHLSQSTTVTSAANHAQNLMRAQTMLPTVMQTGHTASLELQHDNLQSFRLESPPRDAPLASTEMRISHDNGFASNLPPDVIARDVTGVVAAQTTLSDTVLSQLQRPNEQQLETTFQQQDFTQKQMPPLQTSPGALLGNTETPPHLQYQQPNSFAFNKSDASSLGRLESEGDSAAENLMRELEGLSSGVDVRWEDCDLAAMSPCSLLDALDNIDSTPMEQLDSLVHDCAGALQLDDDVKTFTPSQLVSANSIDVQPQSQFSGIIDELSPTAKVGRITQNSNSLPAVTSYAPVECKCGDDCDVIVVAPCINEGSSYSVRFGCETVKAVVLQKGVLTCKTPGFHSLHLNLLDTIMFLL